MDNQQEYDFCVCGNGMVGSAMALGLASQGFNVAWVAPEVLAPFNPKDLPDIRMSAISLGSVKLLDRIGAWKHILAMRCRPYTDLRVWETDGIETAFSAKEIEQAYLGYFVENRMVQLGCAAQAESYANIKRFSSPVLNVINSSQGVQIELDDDTLLNSKWVIGAEGAHSKVRKDAGIATQGWQYQQQAMGIIVELQHSAAAETWQQFYSSGPRALLPMHDNFAALIWYDAAETLKALNSLSDDNLLKQVISAFPKRLPHVSKILSRATFPLNRMHANDYVKERTILVGDAAHTVNPLAGQGVNLGFGDVKALLAVLEKVSSDDLVTQTFARRLVREYEGSHKQKNRLMMTALEGIYHTFKAPSIPAQLVRNIGLFAAQHSGFAKKQVIKFAAGLE